MSLMAADHHDTIMMASDRPGRATAATVTVAGESWEPGDLPGPVPPRTQAELSELSPAGPASAWRDSIIMIISVTVQRVRPAEA